MKNFIKVCLLAMGFMVTYNSYAQTEVTYYTTMGNFKVMLTDTLTPITVDSFLSRVTAKFYDGLIFHRVIDNFVIQGGDPLGTGYGGPGYTTPDEFVASLTNVPGSLAMANSGPNTNGSQFYFNLVNNSSLNGHYTVFGMTTSGFSVIQAIGHVPTNSSDRPITDVVMDSVRITQWPASVGNIEKGIGSSIYPNPGNGVFTISLPDIATTVEIVNMRGQVVYSATAKDKLAIDLHRQPAGLYVARMANANGKWVGKIIVQ